MFAVDERAASVLGIVVATTGRSCPKG